MKLAINGIIKFLLGVIMVSLLLFIPAGTLAFWNAWVFMGLLFIPMIFVGILLFIKKPELLAKRLNGNEKEKTQKFVIKRNKCIDFLFVMVYDIFENYRMFLRNESFTCVSTKHYF